MVTINVIIILLLYRDTGLLSSLESLLKRMTESLGTGLWACDEILNAYCIYLQFMVEGPLLEACYQ